MRFVYARHAARVPQLPLSSLRSRSPPNRHSSDVNRYETLRILPGENSWLAHVREIVSSNVSSGSDSMRTLQWAITGAVAMALAGCGADEISSAGSAGNITINNPPPSSGNPSPGPGAPGDVQPAAGCPTIEDPAGLRDYGTITGPTGTYRVCALPNRFTRSATLPRVPGLLYTLDGRVDVGFDNGPVPQDDEESVVLTIEP